jgi:serine protease Do
MKTALKLRAFVVFAVVCIGATSNIYAAPPSGFRDVVKPLLPAVVNISTKGEIPGGMGLEMPNLPEGHPLSEMFRHFFEENYRNQTQKTTSLGSGVIIDANGHILTCNHVVRDANEITVTLNDEGQTKFKAKLIGRDPRTDIALLKIDAKKRLPFVKLGDSDEAQVGDWIIAIGNPFGLGSTVTAGIVSTTSRQINPGGNGSFAGVDYVSGYIQTDAAINVGNSGGPMFNTNGEVIGVNNSILTNPAAGGSIGIGFAIPSNTAKDVISQLLKYGRTRRGWIGIRIQDMTEEISEALGLKKNQGALVGSVVEKGPADKAGLKSRDVILKLNNEDVKDSRSLQYLVGQSEIGKPVMLQVWRDGKMISVKANIGEFEKAQDEGLVEKAPMPYSEDAKAEKILGLSTRPLNKTEKERLGKDINGLLIVGVEQSSEAAEKGLRGTDLIIEVDGKKVTKPQEFEDQVKKAGQSGKKVVLMLVARGTELSYIALKVNDKADDKKK